MTKTSPNNSTKSNAPAKKKTTTKSSSSTSSKRGSGGGGPQRILDLALTIEIRSGGDINVPRKTIASLSGIKSNTFPVTISGMKKKGLIDYDKDYIRLTDLGRSKATASDSVEDIAVDNESTLADIKARLKLGGMAGLLFDFLSDGRVRDRGTVAAEIDCTNKGTFAVMLSNLRKKGVIAYDSTTIQLSDMCFPRGRPSADPIESANPTLHQSV